MIQRIFLHITRWFLHTAEGRSLGKCLIFFTLFFLLFHPRFDTNDDVRQAMIASGTGILEQPDPHILFPHIYIGQVLQTAYSYLPSFPHYGFLMYFALILGTWMLVCVLESTGKTSWIWMIWGILPLSLNVQYTGIAFILSLGGLMLLFHANRNVVQFSAILAVLLASMIRWEASLLVGILVIFAIGIRLLEVKRKSYLGLNVGILILLACLLRWAHVAHYANESGWHNFAYQNALRAEITDYDHIPFSPQTEAYYEQMGWDKSAFQLYQSWFLADTNVHAISKVEKLVKEKKWFWSWENERLTQRFKGLFTQNLLAALLLCPLVIFFLFLTSTYRKRFFLLFLLIASLLLYLAFDRWLHHRISLPVFAFLLYLILIHSPELWKKWAKTVILSASLLYTSAYLYRDYQEAIRMEKAEKTFTQIPDNQLFFIWADSFPYEYIFRPFEENQQLFSTKELIPLGMTVYTPFFRKKMEKHRFKHIHQALQAPKAVLIARPELLPSYQEFMETYYQQAIEFEAVTADSSIHFYGWKVRDL